MNRPNSMRTALVLLTLAATILSACGEPLEAGDLGAICTGVLDVDPAYEYYDQIAQLVKVGSDELRAAVDPVEDADGSRDVTGILEAPSRERISSDSRADAIGTVLIDASRASDVIALPNDEDVLIGIWNPPASEESYLTIIAIPMADGDLTFAGNCGNEKFRTSLASYRAEVRPDEELEDVMVAVIDDDRVLSDFKDWYNQEGDYAPTPFVDLNPKDRTLDVDDPEAEKTIANLQPFELSITVPVGWRAIPGAALCTFIPSSGWNECTALEAVDAGPVPVSGFQDPSGAVEIYLVDYTEAGVADPIAYLGSLLGVDDEVRNVTIRDQGSSATYEQIKDSADSGSIRIEG